MCALQDTCEQDIVYKGLTCIQVMCVKDCASMTDYYKKNFTSKSYSTKEGKEFGVLKSFSWSSQTLQKQRWKAQTLTMLALKKLNTLHANLAG